MAADITLIPASAEGGQIEQLKKEVQGVPGTTDQPVLSFYGFDTELFDVDVYVEDAGGNSSPAATTRGLGLGNAGASSSGPGTSTPGVTYTAGDGIDITGNVISAPVPELLDPLTYQVMAGTAVGYVGYASLEAAAAAAPNRPIVVNAPRLTITQDVTLTGSLYAASLVQILIADGVTVTLSTGIRLHNIQFLRANGSTAKVAIAATLGTGVVPDATQAVQLVDSRIGPNLIFSAVGHAITVRGRSAIDNAVGNPGTIYLYDTGTATIQPGGPAVVDRRPGATGGAAADTTSCTAICGDQLNGTTVTPVFNSDVQGFIAPLDSAPADAGNNFNAAGHYYTVPVSGRYFISTRIRFADNTPAGMSYNQFPATPGGGADQALFSSTTPKRSALLNIWQPHLTAGQRVYLTVFMENFSADLSATMEIRLIKAD